MNFRKVILIITSLVILVGILINNAPLIKAITIDDLVPQITSLQNQINQIKKQLAEIEKTANSLAESISQLTKKVVVTPQPETTVESIKKQISSVSEAISQLTQELQKISPTPTKPETEYKCPDLNLDGLVDMKDIRFVSEKINTCLGNIDYDPKADVNGDNCITMTDVTYVSKYFGKETTGITQCTGAVVKLPTLSVAISAKPSSGTVPLTGVDLTANISGTATGPINCTFYCNRTDAGTNITSGWCEKKDGVSQVPYTATDCCNFSSAGIYTAKIIVERGTSQAEARISIQVNPTNPKPESEYKCPDLNLDGLVDMKDIRFVSEKINTCLGDLNYDPKADVDGDNCITMTDVNYVSKYFGKGTTGITQCAGVVIKPPTKPESEYKCPDLILDGIIDMKDVRLVSSKVNTCLGDLNYDPKADVDGDNCITMTDVNYVSKYFGQSTSGIEQCK